MAVVEDKLRSMGLELPEVTKAPGPALPRVSAVQTGNLVFVSGHTPFKDGKFVYIGKLGREFDVDQGYEAAKITVLNCLAGLKEVIGDLDRVERVVKMLGMVNCTPDFAQQPKVVNGASDLLVQLFGDAGRHARSAVGMNSLPQGQAVEIELVVELKPA